MIGVDEVTAIGAGTFAIQQPAKYVGYWTIGGPSGLRVAMTRRPRWLTRVLCRWLLEWIWTDGALQ